MYEEKRVTNDDNDNELEMWENVSCPDPRQCLVICMPSVSAEIRTCYLPYKNHKCRMPHCAYSASNVLTNPV
jgi:hypothetical protein